MSFMCQFVAILTVHLRTCPISVDQPWRQTCHSCRSTVLKCRLSGTTGFRYVDSMISLFSSSYFYTFCRFTLRCVDEILLPLLSLTMRNAWRKSPRVARFLRFDSYRRCSSCKTLYSFVIHTDCEDLFAKSCVISTLLPQSRSFNLHVATSQFSNETATRSPLAWAGGF